MNRTQKKLILVVVIMLLASGYDVARQYFFAGDATSQPLQQTSSLSSGSAQNHGALLTKIRAAHDSQKSGWWLEAEGEVIKTLKDDTNGSEHQRFILRLAPDITLLVAHNTDLADRVPLSVGDLIKLRARYEWNHKGGVLHWTHHDPKGKQKGGWIEYQDKRYQ